jgi:hypothetical protein
MSSYKAGPLSLPRVTGHYYDSSDVQLKQQTVGEYEASRLSGHPLKRRSASNYVEAKVRIRNSAVLPSAPDLDKRQFLFKDYGVDHTAMAKVVGYDKSYDGKLQSAGTSRVGLPCISDNAGPCVMVAVGGEAEDGAKARLFHAFPLNKNVTKDIDEYISKLKKEGKSV